ncbi:GLPGLI family protein [Flavobacterium agricola]|uniref:GLPGLI family protein n=1 Tax=Flavobacterium agricola TaxID=2870839 RepID=A0ABY6LWT2_9FLAO|nr:GLPGLI family protein [Flavobacterium agricola]UYW00799.1 GLPGLI family protein [Flavobacterium agricola]
MQKVLYIFLSLFTLSAYAQNVQIKYQNTFANIKNVGLNMEQSTLVLANQTAWFYCEESPQKIHFVNSYFYNLQNVTGYMVFPKSDILGIDQPYLVPVKIPDWKITTNQKNIAGYVCYKATGQYTNLATGVTDIIEAWFAKDLPYSVGPNGAMGLPGIILEYTSKELNFLATEVLLNNTTESIPWPSYPVVSLQEIDKIIDAKIGHFKSKNE